MIADLDAYARSRLDGKYQPEEPTEVEFTGLMMPYHVVLPLFMAWEKHGVMAEAGGYLDQPAWWHNDMRIMQRVYGAVAWYINADIKERAETESREPQWPKM